MWQLKKVQATNICAFKEFAYDLDQSRTTLLFGDNQDNDSQGTNGSGKSALIECIAIGLTGEPLRNVKVDEIINDAADTADIELHLCNVTLNCELTVRRTLSRKSPQAITVYQNGEQCVKSSVAEYNKFILEEIGVSKDDVYANYILSKHKYSSFLLCSDREKKEIINRFSNGDLVDESIAALQADMEPLEKRMADQTAAVAACNGKVEAIKEQIENAKESKADRIRAAKDKIEKWNEDIAAKRADIRQTKATIDATDKHLDELSAYSEKLGELEQEHGSITATYNAISDSLKQNKLDPIADYCGKVNSILASIGDEKAKSAHASKEASDLSKKMSDLQHELDQMNERHKKDAEPLKTTYNSNGEKITASISKINAIAAQIRQLNLDAVTCQGRVRKLEAALAGSIMCPKCHYEFILNSDATVDSIKHDAEAERQKLDDVNKAIDNANTERDAISVKADEMRKENESIRITMDEWVKEQQALSLQLNTISSSLRTQELMLSTANSRLETLQKNLDGIFQQMFDEAFQIIETAINRGERYLTQLDKTIKDDESYIASLEASIKEMENVSGNELEDSLQASLVKYQDDLDKAVKTQTELNAEYGVFKAQEVTFAEFKTYLANSKVQALNDITNEFLAAIGSDIRIAMSGYTVLKSGKIRDKISISLLRDGVDCGSFDKFSEGEKARVNLANILAMHKLTNLNCAEGRGIDLLILDEILEATDEMGLASIFEALNQLHLTAMVVSHGNIAEGYPYKLIVHKKNGISYI